MVISIQLTERQEKIIEIVKLDQPITAEKIAQQLDLTRGTLRPDLAILTMSGILDARPKVGYFYTGKTTFSFISEKIKEARVADRKAVPVVVEEETIIYDAIVMMFLEDVDSIYITSKGYLTGVVSKKDFLKNAIGGLNLHNTPVGVIMTRMPNIVLTTPEESLLEAAMKLMDHEIESIPVVEEEILDKEERAYRVVGVINKTTVTRFLVELGNND